MTKIEIKLIYFIPFFFGCGFALAQKPDVDKTIRKIDNLIYYNEFKLAEDKVDSLYDLLKKRPGKEYVSQILALRYQKALIIDDQFDHGNALPIFMEVLEGAEKNKLHHLNCRANIRIAFNQEKATNYDLAYKYLNAASKLSKAHRLNDLYSAILIRYALLHRFMGDKKNSITTDQRQRLSKLKFEGSIDSAVYYSKKAIDYAIKYNKEYDLNEAYVTMGILYTKNKKNRVDESTGYYLKTIPYWKKTRNYESVSAMNLNVALNYLQAGNFEAALKYNDSAYKYYNNASIYYQYVIPNQRSEIFYSLKKPDSAYHYLKIASDDKQRRYDAQDLSNTKRLEEQYQNDKKQATIESKTQQMILIASLLFVIAITSALLLVQNRKIKSRNKIINKQLAELSKTLEQKQVLLSELQHRVKNNLQHVISILEIQKESVDFNNIDELIRGNQNRIHSMALLHKKLNVSDHVNDVDLKRYVTELSELVKDSYENHKKKIILNVRCDVESFSIEKSLPLGLIITELVSNSMKHAFKRQNTGIINIKIIKSQTANQLFYSDNGMGYDFNTTSEKGLGQEIIKGLIDQLDGTVETNSENGFQIEIHFK